MAKRYRRTPTDPPESDGSHASETAGGKPASDLPQREPASLGKLHEIDLGQETKLRNIARTEAATKKLADDDDVSPGDEAAPAPPTKDEKPWRSRKRRNSEDMERDRLVEEVLRESKCNRCPTFLHDVPLTMSIFLQWMSMTNPRKATGQTTRLQMTRLLSNSGAISLTPSSRGDVSRARKTQSQRTSQNRQRDPSLEAVAAPGRPCGKCRRNRGRNKSLQAGFTPYTVLPGSYHSTRCKPFGPYDGFGMVTRGRWILPYRILRRGRRHSMHAGWPAREQAQGAAFGGDESACVSQVEWHFSTGLSDIYRRPAWGFRSPYKKHASTGQDFVALISHKGSRIRRWSDRRLLTRNLCPVVLFY